MTKLTHQEIELITALKANLRDGDSPIKALVMAGDWMGIEESTAVTLISNIAIKCLEDQQ